MTDYPNNIPAKLEIIKASEITPKEVRWLWYPYIPFGKVTLLLSLAALLSKGASLPFADEDENGEPMTVIYQTTEDDAGDTVVPRFNSAGGDGDRLIFIKEDEKSLTFGEDRIREAVEKYHAKLLILDPMSSYIGGDCSMNNANETRAEFNHLIAVAKDTGCAIVIIAYMNKAKDTSPLYRTNGSIDIAGAARSILAVTRTANKQNPDERYLVQVKSNLAPMGSAILFEVRSLPIVRRGGSVRIAAESGTPLFLPVPVGVNARIAVGTYSRKGLTICRQHTLKLLRSGRRRTCL